MKQFGDCIFVGHGVRHDLQAIGMPITRFVDTSFFEDMGTPGDVEFKRKNPKKLKELTALYLSAVIQAKHHSSVRLMYVNFDRWSTPEQQWHCSSADRSTSSRGLVFTTLQLKVTREDELVATEARTSRSATSM